MTQKQFILALDSGSQSSRAILFDRGGAVLAVGRATHAAMKHPVEGAVEQDPIDIRDCVFSAIRDCLQAWGGDPGQIAGAALTTQRSTVLLADKDGKPLLDAVSWLDRRIASLDSEPSPLLRTALRALGPQSMVPRLLSKSWPRQWREREPETLKKAAYIASIEAWLHHQLVGRVVTAPGGVVGTWPLDIKARKWTRSSFMYSLLGYEKKWLPDIVEAGGEIGRLTNETASKTGLPAGLPFYACGGDKQAEALGAGVRAGRKDVAAVSLGTGSSICIPWPKPVTSQMYNWLTMAGAEPGCWCHEYLLFRGMWTARWFATELGADLEAKAKKTGRPIEALLCDEAEQTPVGADGLMVWPRWSPTLQFPSETGTCIGLRETHTRGHFFRALLEGIGFDLRRGRGILEKALGTKVKEIRVGGGGARSHLVVQILADIQGLPVARPQSEELAARGAAIVAAVGSGVYPSIERAVKEMVPEAPVVQPDSSHVALYDRMYKNAYLPGLKILRKISGDLAAATRG